MIFFTYQELRLAYTDQGEGAPCLLIHGFASNQKVNWFETGWVDFLLKSGRRVMTFDHRGHGLSDKPHDPALYTPELMAEDARALLDHLNVAKADIMGYSMGARVAAFFLLVHPDRICSAVLAGIGAGLTQGLKDSQEIADALEAPSLKDVATQKGRMFRTFAEQTKSDLKALSACILGTRKPIPPEKLQDIHVPVLVVTGTKDTIADPGAELAKLIPGAELLDIIGRDHMRTVGDRQYKEGVLDFWNRRSTCSNPGQEMKGKNYGR